MEIVCDRTITSELLELDNKSFINCTLVDCVLEFRGGPVAFDTTHMRGCRYVFFDQARSTVHFLQGVGLMPWVPSDWGEEPEIVN